MFMLQNFFFASFFFVENINSVNKYKEKEWGELSCRLE
jgi:hypothetical protein